VKSILERQEKQKSIEKRVDELFHETEVKQPEQ